MNASLFLAQAFGLYFVLVGLAMILRWDIVKGWMNDLAGNKTVVFGAGIFALMLGIPLILTHNVWSGGWPVLITILVWITFIKGVVNTFAPEIFIILGAYLLLIGFGVLA